MAAPFLSLLQGNEARQTFHQADNVEAEEQDELVFSEFPAQARESPQTRGSSWPDVSEGDALIQRRIHQLFSGDMVLHFSRWIE